MKIDWKTKLSSRKLWVLIASFVSANLLLFGIDPGVTVKIVAAIGEFGSIAVYILSQGLVDAAEKNNQPLFPANLFADDPASAPPPAAADSNTPE